MVGMAHVLATAASQRGRILLRVACFPEVASRRTAEVMAAQDDSDDEKFSVGDEGHIGSQYFCHLNHSTID
jgi:hypothetical protein